MLQWQSTIISSQAQYVPADSGRKWRIVSNLEDRKLVRKVPRNGDRWVVAL